MVLLTFYDAVLVVVGGAVRVSHGEQLRVFPCCRVSLDAHDHHEHAHSQLQQAQLEDGCELVSVVTQNSLESAKGRGLMLIRSPCAATLEVIVQVRAAPIPT